MLAELIIAAALVLTLLGSVFMLLDPARGALRVAPEATEIQQRVRMVFARLHTEILTAGSGPHPAEGVTVAALRAPLVPARLTGRDAVRGWTRFAPAAISLLSADARDAGAILTSPLVGSRAQVRLGDGPPCVATRPNCGLEADAIALVFDETGQSDLFRVIGVRGDLMTVEPLGGGAALPFATGARIAPLRVRAYYLDPAADQVRYQDGLASDVPLLDNVVGLSFRYFGSPTLPGDPVTGPVAPCLAAARLSLDPQMRATEVELSPEALSDGPWCGTRFPYDVDLFRVRRVRVSIRVQVADSRLRGRDLEMFARPGFAGRGQAIVPDRIASFDLTPRNALANR